MKPADYHIYFARTREEVARIMRQRGHHIGVTDVRRAEDRALRKLRRDPEMRKLMDGLEQ